jgi:hypothetical protein
MTLIFMICIMLAATLPAGAAGPYDIRLPASPEGFDPQALTLVGSIQHYRIQKGGDLLEVARHYGLGYSELAVLSTNRARSASARGTFTSRYTRMCTSKSSL